MRGKKGLVPSNFIEEISMPENSYSHSSDMYTSRSGGESYSRTAQSSSTSYGQTTSSQQQQQRSMTSSGLTTSEYEKRSSLSTNGGRKRVSLFINRRHRYVGMAFSPGEPRQLLDHICSYFKFD